MPYNPTANLDKIPGKLPTGTVPEHVDKSTIAAEAASWMNELDEPLLTEDAVWRDLLSFTDTFRTFYSSPVISKVFPELTKEKSRSNFKLTNRQPRFNKLGDNSWLDIDLTFTTRDGALVGNCAAIVSILQDSGRQWKIWMIRTWLENFEGHGHPDVPKPLIANGLTNGISSDHEHIYDAIVAGGGQSGLGAAGRFQALGIDYILFDERTSIGDSWAKRYDSLKWHTIKEYGNLPFGRTFTAEQPTLLPTKEIGTGYKDWATRHGINAREGTSVDSAEWDDAAQIWTVHTSGQHGSQRWKCRNVILSVGVGRRTRTRPEWASEDQIKTSGFKGKIIHSTDYRNVNDFAGKRGVVIGTANTAHDVAEDMATAEMETTMIQRGATWVLPGDFLVHAFEPLYNREKPTSEADRDQVTMPHKIASDIANTHIWAGIDAQPQMWDDLNAAGFKTYKHGKVFEHIYGRMGGHYVDIGNCARIINGQVKVKSQPVQKLTEDGLLFEDGSELGADLIVLCTGFGHDFRQDAERIVGKETAAQMDDFYGLDDEGEIKGLAKRAGHPHFWYFSGEVRNARFYSMPLALQIQKLKLGGELRPYLGYKKQVK